jgi:hypothetical protein
VGVVAGSGHAIFDSAEATDVAGCGAGRGDLPGGFRVLVEDGSPQRGCAADHHDHGARVGAWGRLADHRSVGDEHDPTYVESAAAEHHHCDRQ